MTVNMIVIGTCFLFALYFLAPVCLGKVCNNLHKLWWSNSASFCVSNYANSSACSGTFFSSYCVFFIVECDNLSVIHTVSMVTNWRSISIGKGKFLPRRIEAHQLSNEKLAK